VEAIKDELQVITEAGGLKLMGLPFEVFDCRDAQQDS